MAYRVPFSADLDRTQNLFDFDFAAPDTGNQFFQNTLGPPLLGASSNSNAFPLNTDPFNNVPNFNQQFQTPQLPPLPAVFPERHFADTFGSQQTNPSFPNYQYHHQSPPATTYNRGREGPSWLPDPTYAGLDPNPRRPTPTYVEHRTGVAPLNAQQPRLPSSTTYNSRTHNRQSFRSGPEPNSDDYLSALVDGNFSSPSLPPIASSPLQNTRLQSANLPKPLEIGEAMPSEPHSRRASRGNPVDLTKEEPNFDSTSGIDPNTPSMPPTTRKRGATAVNGETQITPSKRRRASRSSPSTAGRANKAKPKQSAANPFSDEEIPECEALGPDTQETIDLSNATEDVPQELLAPKVDSRIKLGQFQCVICMDDTACLTVTHCGHLFCSACLHSALHIDNMKKTCPVCRTKVDTKEKKGRGQQKSYYHLELKILTANKKGKRPAEA
ncbi:uncharacterized protein F4822DRAFT_386078 [Hypoxylon trugodes]|uniref:uncharacterized protein n=1 Tax=Hypoxylon trugodes TaxID=326681 RepID=UPI00219D7727|nr:uncharacterized protein F4822DRAFT_386078 [Hypoxylon trugodes]KAI1393827.1 hypothetical protein F4822DRAFT_386078 [Hypoxylon trugodes]